MSIRSLDDDKGPKLDELLYGKKVENKVVGHAIAQWKTAIDNARISGAERSSRRCLTLRQVWVRMGWVMFIVILFYLIIHPFDKLKPLFYKGETAVEQETRLK